MSRIYWRGAYQNQYKARAYGMPYFAAIDARNLSITLFHSNGQIDRVVETVRLRPIALSSVGFTSFSFEQHETYLDLRWGKSCG